MSALAAADGRSDRFRQLARSVLVAMVCVPMAVLAQPARKSQSSELEKQKAALARIEDEWLNALNSANVPVIAAILADDFVRPAPDAGQFVAKGELLRYYRSHLRPQGAHHKRIDDLSVHVYGSVAIARVEWTPRLRQPVNPLFAVR